MAEKVSFFLYLMKFSSKGMIDPDVIKKHWTEGQLVCVDLGRISDHLLHKAHWELCLFCGRNSHEKGLEESQG